ncbi:class I SAM-dependent methyltransferase [Shewanella electrodiphila]|uniref:Class I SAM-dependent methyltransferase n=1 Tax=Shewanella electrodiphila TaxID=934143 RepID=A0ABT0KTW1_9GAMM|nr:class I SAM-dependent methyltransferase [Shewanella electrodiphila]MCL1046790.1 class I SAM-dependent methyltransferase [Shewanella electrodiphila]
MDKVNETVSTFNKMAQKYQDKYMDCDLYSDSLDKLCGLIFEKQTLHRSTILEVGCGPGNVSQYLLNWRSTDNEKLNIDIAGFDLAPAMIKLAKQNNPQCHYHVRDMRDLNDLCPQSSADTFNIAICAFCIPYLEQFELTQFITDLANVLAANSLLFISFMEDDYQNSVTQESAVGDRVHIHYFQSEDVIKLCQAQGFELVEKHTKDYLVDDVKQATDCFIYLRRE